MIEARMASLAYMDHGREILACQNISLNVEPGEFLGILGPSGSGKSSLLYLLSGLKHPTSGQVFYEDRCMNGMGDTELSRLRLREFGFVFQYPYLLGYLSALENVMVARPDQESRKEAENLLKNLGLGEKTHRLPHELSGGEKQRVCVARALLGRPRVIFADEPTAALDHRNGVAVVQMLREARGEGALVIVTHDPTMLEGADRILAMADGILLEIAQLAT